MTISSTENRKDYTGDGATTSFSFPYVFFADSDLDVYLDGVLQVLNSDYTISGTLADGRYASGANVVFTVAPPNNDGVAIVRDIPYTQAVDYAAYDSFPAETHETALDRAAVRDQQILSLLEGVLRISPAEADIGYLPLVADRGSKYLAFDASGDPIASDAAISTTAMSAFIETLVDDANAAAARATLEIDTAGDARWVKQGDHTLWIPASAMIPRTTNGAAAGSAELATNKINLRTLDFDQTTQEYAQFFIGMPKSWDLGNIDIEFIWTAAGGAGDVVWQGEAVAISNDDALDAAFGTSGTVTDTLLAVNDSHRCRADNITPAGTPAQHDTLIVQVSRKAGDAADTHNADAKLLGCKVIYTTNVGNDA